MRYNLNDYKVSISLPPELNGFSVGNEQETQGRSKEIVIGGGKSYLSSITISQNNTLFTTSADDTGSWIHNMSYKRNGVVSITLNMLCNNAGYLRNLFNLYYPASSDGNARYISGATIVVTDLKGTELVTCNDCYPESIPNYDFRSTASDQTWSFTCGEIIFESSPFYE